VVDPARVLNIREKVVEKFKTCENRVSSEKWGTPEFDAYLEQYAEIMETEDYKVIRKQLEIVQDSHHLNCAYLIWFDLETESTIYLVDASHEDNCPPGCFDEIMYEVDHEAMRNPQNGIASDVTNTEE